MPLAKYLAGKGHQLKGSVTSEAKTNELSDAGITPYILFWEKDGFKGNLASFLENDILIITVPPSKVAAAGGLQDMVHALLSSLKIAAVSKVIFISSTSVYGNAVGDVTEETLVAPDTASAKDIVSAEGMLRSHLEIHSTIIRFGGLVGPNRHPIYHLSGKENVADPDAPINLIHLNDCIGIIEAIISQKKWGQIFNAAAPFHPSKKEYYTKKAMSLGLLPPKFNTETSANGKIILSKKAEDLLHYTFSVTEMI